VSAVDWTEPRPFWEQITALHGCYVCLSLKFGDFTFCGVRDFQDDGGNTIADLFQLAQHAN
jgi:hypothetical protein